MGKGETLKDIIETLGSVSEGVPTTKAAFNLCLKLGVDCPIIEEVYKILYEEKNVDSAINDLLNLESKIELDLIIN